MRRGALRRRHRQQPPRVERRRAGLRFRREAAADAEEVALRVGPRGGVERPDAKLSAGPSEALTLLCALLFAVQILCVDRFAPRVDPVALAAGEFLFGFLAGLPFLALPSEAPRLSLAAFRAALPAIAFAGFLSSGVAYTLQIVAQKRTRPAIASLLMSLEAVFAALCGRIFLREALSPRQIVGCALVFVAVALVQLLAARAPSSRP